MTNDRQTIPEIFAGYPHVTDEDRLLESSGQTLREMADHLARGELWDDAECDAAEQLLRACINGSTARRWRLDSAAEDVVVDAAAEAKGE